MRMTRVKTDKLISYGSIISMPDPLPNIPVKVEKDKDEHQMQLLDFTFVGRPKRSLLVMMMPFNFIQCN